MVAVSVEGAALFAAGIVAFELAAWYAVQKAWQVTLWYNQRVIDARKEVEADEQG